MNTVNHNLAKRTLFLFSILVFLAFSVQPVIALQNINIEGASNDDILTAAVITAIPYRNTVSPFGATQAPGDPVSTGCNLAAGLATVWYKYTPAANVLVHMDSIGSSYDTYMVLFKDNSGTLTEVACNDDATTGQFASAINISLTAGVIYYIEVAQFNGYLTDVGMEHSKALADAGTIRAEGETHVFRLVPLVTRVFNSVGAYDGFVMESTETSGVGLSRNSTLPIIKMGDDEKKRQYRAVLSFNTAILPDDAVIRFASIKVKQNLINPANIFSRLGYLKVNIGSPYFGTGYGLESADFQSPGTYCGAFSKTPVSGWYKVNLRSNSFLLVNRTGGTQFRLQFTKDDDNDTAVDYIAFYSGNSTAKPVLTLQYYVP